ncbi:hypothetical protein HDU76_003775 [Blyttiomyces sp. JEL0837]|nr:hypothetical protein HDU76_003775 [Blyttiomyces sp. JEL0837]
MAILRLSDSMRTLYTYAVFLLFGVTSLIAWNTWITAAAFFRKRLDGSIYADSFQNWFAMTYFVTNLGFNSYVTPNVRIVAGVSTNAIVFTTSALLVSWGSELDPVPYFHITLFLVALSAVSAASIAGIFAFAAEYPGIFMQGISTGQGISGLVPSIISLFLLLTSSQVNTTDAEDYTATRSFLNTTLLSVVSLASFFTIPSPESLRPYERIPEIESTPINENIVTDAPPSLSRDTQPPNDEERPPFFPIVSPITLRGLFPIVKTLSVAVFLNFLLTLSLFPGITAAVTSTTARTTRDRDAFVSAMFVVFNIGDVMGKFQLNNLPAAYFVPLQAAPGFSFLFSKSPRNLFVLSIARFIFIPLVFFSNVQYVNPDGSHIPRILPVLFGDGIFTLIMFSLAATGGYMATNVLMLAPQMVVGPEKQRTVADMMVFSLSAGLAGGSIMSYFLRML